MASFKNLVNMERSPEEKVEAMMPPIAQQNDYPGGLCICLSEHELEKLDLDDDCEVGNMLHGFFMAEVTSVSKNETNGKSSCRIELQITHLGLEDETHEEEPEEEAAEDE